MQEKTYYVVTGGILLPRPTHGHGEFKLNSVPAKLLALCLEREVDCENNLLKDKIGADKVFLFTDKQTAEKYSREKSGAGILYPIFEVTAPLDTSSSAFLTTDRKKIVAIDLPGYSPKDGWQRNPKRLVYFPKTILEEADRPFFDKYFVACLALTFWTVFIPIIYSIYRLNKARSAKEALADSATRVGRSIRESDKAVEFSWVEMAPCSRTDTSFIGGIYRRWLPAAYEGKQLAEMFPDLLARINGEETLYKPISDFTILSYDNMQLKGWEIGDLIRQDHTNNEVTKSYMLEIAMQPPQKISGTSFFIPVCKENAIIIRQMIKANYASYFKYEDGEFTPKGELVLSELDKIESGLTSSSIKEGKDSWSKSTTTSTSWRLNDTLTIPAPSLAKTKITTPNPKPSAGATEIYQTLFPKAYNMDQLNKLFKRLWIREYGGYMRYQPIRNNSSSFEELGRWKKVNENPAETEMLASNQEIINPITEKPMLEILFRPGGRSTSVHYIAVCQENADIIKLMIEVNCLGIFTDENGKPTKIKNSVEKELSEIEAKLSSLSVNKNT